MPHCLYGQGSITKLSGKRSKPWSVRVNRTVNGKREVQYLGYYKTEEEAIAARAEFNRTSNFDEFKRKQVTYKEMYELWFDVQGKDLNESNLSTYIMAFNLTSELHNLKLAEIAPIQLQKVIDECGKSFSTKSKIKNLYNKIYDFAKFIGINIENAADYVKVKGKQKNAGKPFSQEEIAALWETIDDQTSQDCLILIYTGLRINEYLAITLDQIDLEQQCMFIDGSKTEAGKNRIIPLHRDIFELVAMRKENNRKFLAENSRSALRYTTFNKRFKKRCGEDHRIHDTRHTTASLMAGANIEVYIRKHILGHSDRDITTGLYTHLQPSHLVDEINKINVISE